MDKNYSEIEKRIAMLTGRVFSLEKEVSTLKEQVAKYEQMTPNAVAEKEMPVFTQQPEVKQAPEAQSQMSTQQTPEAQSQMSAQSVSQSQPAAQPTTATAAQGISQPIPQRTPQAPIQRIAQPAPRKSMESKIGKNLMGILASVLILFSIILFGGLLYPFISDGVKVIIMYLVSIGFAAFGIVKMRRDDRYNTLFTAISACGISAVYVSTLITYFGYHMISEYLLLLIIALWLIVTGVLAKLKSSIFTYICNIGLIIASFLAMLQWNKNVAGIALYFVGIFVLFGFNFKRDFGKDIYYFIQVPVMSIIFALCYFKLDCNVAALSLLGIINIGALVLPNVLYKREEKNFPWLVINTVLTFASSTITLFMLCLVLDKGTDILRFACFIVTVAVSILYYMLYARGEDARYSSLFYVVYYMTLLLTPLTYFVGIVELYIGWSLIYIALIVLGMLKDNKHFRYSGYVFMLMSLASYPFSYTLSFIIMLICVAGIAIWLSKRYCVADKYILTPIVLFGVGLFAGEGFNFNVAFLFYILLSFVINSKLFTVNPVKKEKEKASAIIAHIYTAIVTFILPYYIVHCDIGFTYSRMDELVFATSSGVAKVIFALLFLVIILTKMIAMFKEDDIYSRLFLCVAALLCLITNPDSVGMYFVMASFAAFIVAALMIQLKRNYRAYDKYVIIFIVAAFILSLFEYSNLAIPFILFAVLSIIMNSKLFRLNPDTKEEEPVSVVLGYIVNAILMFVGMICIFSFKKPMEFAEVELLPPVVTIVLISLLTIALFIINTRKVLNSGISKDLSGVYVCLKFTVLIIAILCRLEAASYVFSMVGLVLAIVFIVAGFRFKYKSFRIYGLILTMLSVFKLILFDIEYSSDILRPVGIFISGILCFVISFIYSKIEKQIGEKEREE